MHNQPATPPRALPAAHPRATPDRPRHTAAADVGPLPGEQDQAYLPLLPLPGSLRLVASQEAGRPTMLH